MYQRSAISDQRSAISDQRSAISDQLSAISDQRSAISDQLSAISYQRSAISDQRSAIPVSDSDDLCIVRSPLRQCTPETFRMFWLTVNLIIYLALMSSRVRSKYCLLIGRQNYRCKVIFLDLSIWVENRFSSNNFKSYGCPIFLLGR